MNRVRSLTFALCIFAATSVPVAASQLKLHAIFASNVVLQRDKPIVIWGWAEPGKKVSVQLGSDRAEAAAGEGKGRWEVTLPAREASVEPQELVVTAGDEKVEMTNYRRGRRVGDGRPEQHGLRAFEGAGGRHRVGPGESPAASVLLDRTE
jgi:hypothetical protein